MNLFVKKLMQDAGKSPLALFTREICTNPRAIGAACPSSPGLAQHMAMQVPLRADGLVLELGAGTGVVTEALLNRGVMPQNLVVVERSVALAGHLRKRFPYLRIIQGDAAHLDQLLGCEEQDQIYSVVSSLPLRSLKPAVSRAIGCQLDTLLGSKGLLIHFTYDLRGAYAHLPPHFKRVFSKIIWGNLPPARIEVFQRSLMVPVY
jgi:phospholipid N-methyltransferase